MVSLQVLSVGLMLTTISLLYWKRIVTAIRILALQSFFLGFIAIWMAARTGTSDLYVIAALTILVKGLGIPWVLNYTLKKIDIHRETEKLIGRELSLLAGGALLVVAYVTTSKLEISGMDVPHGVLAISIAMLLIGLLMMMTHKKAIMQGIGLVVMENGLFLAALLLTYGMPFLVDIGVFLDIFVAVILISMLTYRMDRVFQSTNTDHLRRLRG